MEPFHSLVSKMSFLSSFSRTIQWKENQILSKELNSIFHLLFHFLRSFFGRIEDTINCFRDLLTFRKPYKILVTFNSRTEQFQDFKKLQEFRLSIVRYYNRKKKIRRLNTYPSSCGGLGSFGLKLGKRDRKNIPKTLGSSKFGRFDWLREQASIVSVGGSGSQLITGSSANSCLKKPKLIHISMHFRNRHMMS